MSAAGEDRFFGVRQDAIFESLDMSAVSSLRLDREVRHSDRRDEWGNWDGQFADDQETLLIPGVDRRHRKGAFRWNDKHPFALSITHDIDTINPYSAGEYWTRARRRPLSLFSKVRHVAARLKYSLRHAVDQGYCRRLQCCWEFKPWLDAEQAHGFRSTWFVFPEQPEGRVDLDCTYSWHEPARWSVTERVPFVEAIRRLGDFGCEIGLHGSFSSATDAAILRRQRLALEKAVGRPVVSLRQHYLRYDPASTPAVHEAAGFLADSTIGMNRRTGFRAGTSFPFFVYDHAAHRCTGVLEIPLIVQEGAFFSGNGQGTSFSEARKTSLALLDEVERVNGIYSILFHPHSQYDSRSWDLFNLLLEECRRRGAWGATVAELRKSWLGT